MFLIGACIGTSIDLRISVFDARNPPPLGIRLQGQASVSPKASCSGHEHLTPAVNLVSSGHPLAVGL